MAAIGVSADGNNIILALENASGNPVFLAVARSDLSTFTNVYDPGAGTAANVQPSPTNLDSMLFYGNFGTDVTVIQHTISTGAEVDISPASLGAKVINTLVINPAGISEAVASVDTDQDLKNTVDGGTTWTDWDATMGFDGTALWVLWSGAYFPHRYFSGGQTGGTGEIRYSPNEGSSDADKTNTMSVTQIVSIEATEPAP
jgi:hypothetical protein